MKNRTDKNLKLGKTIAFILFLFMLWVLPDVALSQSRLDVPTANLAIENAVPPPLINKIARVKTRELWGKGALGEPVPLSDLDGNIVAYMFSFHRGRGGFPNYDEILTGIKEGRDIHDHVKNSRIEEAKEIYKMLKQKQGNQGNIVVPNNTVTRSDLRIGQIEPITPDGSTPRRIQVAEIREIEKFAAKKAIGADEFGTIIVSATYDRVPVPVYLHYLAPYYTHFDLALEKAQEIIGQGAFLKSIHFLGMGGQYFDFVNDGRSILINAVTLQRKDITEFKKPRLQDSQATEATALQGKQRIKHEIAEDWLKIKKEVGE